MILGFHIAILPCTLDKIKWDPCRLFGVCAYYEYFMLCHGQHPQAIVFSNVDEPSEILFFLGEVALETRDRIENSKL